MKVRFWTNVKARFWTNFGSKNSLFCPEPNSHFVNLFQLKDKKTVPLVFGETKERQKKTGPEPNFQSGQKLVQNLTSQHAYMCINIYMYIYIYIDIYIYAYTYILTLFSGPSLASSGVLSGPSLFVYCVRFIKHYSTWDYSTSVLKRSSHTVKFQGFLAWPSLQFLCCTTLAQIVAPQYGNWLLLFAF